MTKKDLTEKIYERLREYSKKDLAYAVDIMFNAMTDARKRALANMCFQLGADGLSKFKRMIAAIFDENWEQAAIEALDSKWAKQDTPRRAQKVATMLRLGR